MSDNVKNNKSKYASRRNQTESLLHRLLSEKIFPPVQKKLSNFYFEGCLSQSEVDRGRKKTYRKQTLSIRFQCAKRLD